MGRLDLSYAVSAVGDVLLIQYTTFNERHVMDPDFVVQADPIRPDLLQLGHADDGYTVLEWSKETALSATGRDDLVAKIILLTPAPDQFMNRFALTNTALTGGVPALLPFDQVLGSGPSFQVGDGWSMPDVNTVRFAQPGTYVFNAQVVANLGGFFKVVDLRLEQDSVLLHRQYGRLNNPTKTRLSILHLLEITTVPSDIQVFMTYSASGTDANSLAVGFDQLTIFRLTR